MTSKEAIVQVCKEIQEMLLSKNEAYGNSAFEPVQIFSKLSAAEQINVRIDDKLSRILKGKPYGMEDTELDLIGYLILKMAVERVLCPTEKQPETVKNCGTCNQSLWGDVCRSCGLYVFSGWIPQTNKSE